MFPTFRFPPWKYLPESVIIYKSQLRVPVFSCRCQVLGDNFNGAGVGAEAVERSFAKGELTRRTGLSGFRVEERQSNADVSPLAFNLIGDFHGPLGQSHSFQPLSVSCGGATFLCKMPPEWWSFWGFIPAVEQTYLCGQLETFVGASVRSWPQRLCLPLVFLSARVFYFVRLSPVLANSVLQPPTFSFLPDIAEASAIAPDPRSPSPRVQLCGYAPAGIASTGRLDCRGSGVLVVGEYPRVGGGSDYLSHPFGPRPLLPDCHPDYHRHNNHHEDVKPFQEPSPPPPPPPPPPQQQPNNMDMGPNQNGEKRVGRNSKNFSSPRHVINLSNELFRSRALNRFKNGPLYTRRCHESSTTSGVHVPAYFPRHELPHHLGRFVTQTGIQGESRRRHPLNGAGSSEPAPYVALRTPENKQ
ncbi:hypothetical protein AAG570_006904 [Ranatra chinensis]|uniref:Uncharacterized protein n=1 Tax=Ranatra chinensis TaxID=642074 RepID=A0ABD0Z828_9HEMI